MLSRNETDLKQKVNDLIKDRQDLIPLIQKYDKTKLDLGVYFGELVDGKREGKGIFFWNSENYEGNIYNGHWKDN